MGFLITLCHISDDKWLKTNPNALANRRQKNVAFSNVNRQIKIS